MTLEESFVEWLKIECGGGCQTAWALKKWQRSTLDNAVKLGLCEYRGYDSPDEDICLVDMAADQKPSNK